jgi:hypothetical protein
MRRLTLFATLVAASVGVSAIGASSASAAVICQPTTFVRDNHPLTAALINPPTVATEVDATGCDIGVYYSPGTTGDIGGANIHGAVYYGVLVNAAAVNVTNSDVHLIGDNPFSGAQHGVGVFYTTLDQANEIAYQNGQPYTTTVPNARATGTLSDSNIYAYQKNGVVVGGPGAAVTVSGNTVDGEGPISYIAQNGVQFSRGGAGSVTKNRISDHFYSPPDVEACGLLFFNSGAVKSSGNKFRADELNICNFGGRGGGSFSP